ncbi:MAG: fumarate reductase subunit D [Chloroflexi bacterium]|nr:fumarate reductase subunit D [Chloroflexota bacterium]
MRPSHEPLFWAMFSAGGVLIALLMPALIVVTGFIVPAEGVEFDGLDTLFGNVLVRLVVLGVAFFSFFHAAHRIRHTLKDLGLHALAKPIAGVSYLAAAAATLWAAAVVI